MKKIKTFVASFILLLGGFSSYGVLANTKEKNINEANQAINDENGEYHSIITSGHDVVVDWDLGVSDVFQYTTVKIGLYEQSIENPDKNSTSLSIGYTDFYVTPLETDNDSTGSVDFTGLSPEKTYYVTFIMLYGNKIEAESKTDADMQLFRRSDNEKAVTKAKDVKKTNEYERGTFKVLEDTITPSTFDFTFNIYSGGDYQNYQTEDIILKLNYEALTLIEVSSSDVKGESNLQTIHMQAQGLAPNKAYGLFSISVNNDQSTAYLPEIKVHTTGDKIPVLEPEDGDYQGGFSLGSSQYTTFNFWMDIFSGNDYQDYNPNNARLKADGKELNIMSKGEGSYHHDTESKRFTFQATHLNEGTVYKNFTVSLSGKDDDFVPVKGTIQTKENGDIANEYIDGSFHIDNVAVSTFDFEFRVNSGGDYQRYDIANTKLKMVKTIDNEEVTTDIEVRKNFNAYGEEGDIFYMQAIGLEKDTTYSDLQLSINGGVDYVKVKGQAHTDTVGTKEVEFINNSFKIDQNSINPTSFRFSFEVYSGGDYKEFNYKDVVLIANGETLNISLPSTLSTSSNPSNSTQMFTMVASNLKPETTYDSFKLSVNGGTDLSDPIVDIDVTTPENKELIPVKPDGLSIGAIIGIVIGALVLVAIIALTVVFLVKKHNSKEY